MNPLSVRHAHVALPSGAVQPSATLHDPHSVAATPAAKVSAAHGTHAVPLPAAALKWPGVHAWHTVALAS